VDPAIARDETVAWNNLLLHAEIAAAVGDELVQFLERVLVNEQFDALTCRELAFFMLAGAALRSPALVGSLVPAMEFFESIHFGLL